MGDFCQGKKIYQITSHHLRHLTIKKWYFSTPPKCAAPVNWITAHPGPSSPRCASKAASALRIFSHGNTNAEANVGPTHLTYNHNLLSHPPPPPKTNWLANLRLNVQDANEQRPLLEISKTLSDEMFQCNLVIHLGIDSAGVISLPLWHPKKKVVAICLGTRAASLGAWQSLVSVPSR